MNSFITYWEADAMENEMNRSIELIKDPRSMCTNDALKTIGLKVNENTTKHDTN